MTKVGARQPVSRPVKGLLTPLPEELGMIRLLLCLCLGVAACNMAGPYFRGVPVTRVTVDGSVFDVRVRGDLAEAQRQNAEYAPRFGPIRMRAAFAMEQVSGCIVREVQGDQALAIGKPSCSGRSPTWVQPMTPMSYNCVQIGALLNDMPGGPYSEFDCDRY